MGFIARLQTAHGNLGGLPPFWPLVLAANFLAWDLDIPPKVPACVLDMGMVRP
jgi:hypothetical protein